MAFFSFLYVSDVFIVKLGLVLSEIPNETASLQEAQMKRAASNFLRHQMPNAKRNLQINDYKTTLTVDAKARPQ